MLRLPSVGLLQREGEPVQGEDLVMPDYLECEWTPDLQGFCVFCVVLGMQLAALHRHISLQVFLLCKHFRACMASTFYFLEAKASLGIASESN